MASVITSAGTGYRARDRRDPRMSDHDAVSHLDALREQVNRLRDELRRTAGFRGARTTPPAAATRWWS